MYMKTKNNGILINIPEALFRGRPMKDEIAFVEMTVAKSISVGLKDFLEAFKICFQSYSWEHKEFAPTVHALVKIDERIIRLKLNYPEVEDKCIKLLHNQLMEQSL